MGSFNTIIGRSADVGASNLSNATAIGYRARVDQSNSLVLGGINGVNGAFADTNVGIGATTPNARLHVNDGGGHILFTRAGCNAPLAGITFASAVTGTCQNYALLGGDNNTHINRPTGGAIFFREANFTQVTIRSGGTVALEALGAAGSTHLCYNAAKEISACSSSLRYKTAIQAFTGGVELIKRLQPITFT